VTGFPHRRSWGGMLSSAVERRLGRRTETLIAVGSAVAIEAVHRCLVSPDRIRTVLPPPSSADPPHGRAARGRARHRLELPAGVRLVGAAGRIDGKRAPSDWVAAFAAAARSPGGEDIWGVWLGDGPMRERLLDQARRLGVDDRLRLITHYIDVPELLPALDVFAHASRWLAFPRALVNAVAAGVSVVATTGAAAPDLLVPGDAALLVPPARPEVLGRAVRHLLDDPAEARRLADNARAAWMQRLETTERADEVARRYAAV
jgi:glycosyltransferase involved in cell wall biosynthesis